MQRRFAALYGATDRGSLTYDHVMLIYGKAVDQDGKPYYLVKNSWGKGSKYKR